MKANVTTGPLQQSDRVTDLDVLRGVALFGVFLVNMTSFAGSGLLATDAQLGTLGTLPFDEVTMLLVHWLVEDKANTLFAFLFGLGFAIQLQRAEAKGARFESMYLRRLTVLLLFGFINVYFLWVWDILHVYAVAGFLLFACRKLSQRAVLTLGIILLFVDTHAVVFLCHAVGLDFSTAVSPFTDPEVISRQKAALAGYWPFFDAMVRLNLYDYILSGSLVGWIIYAFGRLLIGMWVGRAHWIQHADDYLPLFRKAMRIGIPLGLVASLGVRLLANGLILPPFGSKTMWGNIGDAMRAPAAALLAMGYVGGIVVALRTNGGRKFFAPFRHVGQMALTNYIMQALAYGFLLTGIGPGLGLAGRIGAFNLTLIVIVAFAAQMLFSRLWLARYRFGPLEWLWRSLTYGEKQLMRRK